MPCGQPALGIRVKGILAVGVPRGKETYANIQNPSLATVYTLYLSNRALEVEEDHTQNHIR